MAPSPKTGEQPRAKTGSPGKSSPSGTSGHVVTVLITVLALMCFSMPTFIILIGGMAPSWVTYLVDNRQRPYRLNVIVACNLAGVVPYLGLLWSRQGNVAYAIEILGDVYAWATMYMGAILGSFMLKMGPHVAAMTLNMRMVRERRTLDDMRRRMIEEWGNEVVPPSEKRSSEKTPDVATVTGGVTGPVTGSATGNS